MPGLDGHVTHYCDFEDTPEITDNDIITSVRGGLFSPSRTGGVPLDVARSASAAKFGSKGLRFYDRNASGSIATSIRYTLIPLPLLNEFTIECFVRANPTLTTSAGDPVLTLIDQTYVIEGQTNGRLRMGFAAGAGSGIPILVGPFIGWTPPGGIETIYTPASSSNSWLNHLHPSRWNKIAFSYEGGQFYASSESNEGSPGFAGIPANLLQLIRDQLEEAKFSFLEKDTITLMFYTRGNTEECHIDQLRFSRMNRYGRPGSITINHVGENEAFTEDPADNSIDATTELMLELNNNLTDSAQARTVNGTNITFTSPSPRGTHAAVFSGNSHISVPNISPVSITSQTLECCVHGIFKILGASSPPQGLFGLRLNANNYINVYMSSLGVLSIAVNDAGSPTVTNYTVANFLQIEYIDIKLIVARNVTRNTGLNTQYYYLIVNGKLTATNLVTSPALDLSAGELTIGRVEFADGVFNHLTGECALFAIHSDTNARRIFNGHYFHQWNNDDVKFLGKPLFTGNTTPTPVINDASIFPSNIPDFVQAYNQLYIAGLKPMLKIRDDEIRLLGLGSPPSAPSITEITTGDPDAFATGLEYFYVYTHVNEDNNESGRSPESAGFTTTASTRALLVSIPLAETLPQGVEKVRIYRRLSTESEYFYVDELNLASGNRFEDRLTDDERSPVIIAPRAKLRAVPQANFIANYLNRNYYGFVEDPDSGSIEPTKVYFSELNSLEVTQGNSFFYVGNDDTDVIVGMEVIGRELLIWKERSLWRVLNDPATELFVVEKVQDIGCVSHRTIQLYEDTVIWASDKGIHGYDTRDPILLSGNIQTLFNGIPEINRGWMTSSIDTQKGLYLLSYRDTEGTGNTKTLCFNVEESLRSKSLELFRQVPEQIYTIWTFGAADLVTAFIGSRLAQSFWADTDSFGKIEGTTDFGAAIPWEWHLGKINFIDPFKKQHARFLMFAVETVSAQSIYAGFSLDEAATVEYEFTSTPPMDQLRLKVSRRGKFIQPQLRGESSTPVTILGYKLITGQVGRI